VKVSNPIVPITLLVTPHPAPKTLLWKVHYLAPPVRLPITLEKYLYRTKHGQ
jgi:hypothetical protein